MTEDEAVEALRVIMAKYGHDPEVAHARADAILMRIAPASVREQYEKAADEIGFWYA